MTTRGQVFLPIFFSQNVKTKSSLLSALLFIFVFSTQALATSPTVNEHGKSEHKEAAKADHSQHQTSTHSQNSHGHGDISDSVPAEKALGWLKNGNARYTKGFLRKDGQSAQDRNRLASGQKPHTIVLSCSDSRVPPEVIFDQKLGEIFVIRTAGEALDNAALASIEYAVSHLGTKLIVVMAHESCGAVNAALGTLAGGDAGSPSLNALVKDIHPRLSSFKGQKPSPGLKSEAKANAMGVAKDLVGRSEIISQAMEKSGLSIKTALYHLGSGVVEFF